MSQQEVSHVAKRGRFLEVLIQSRNRNVAEVLRQGGSRARPTVGSDCQAAGWLVFRSAYIFELVRVVDDDKSARRCYAESRFSVVVNLNLAMTLLVCAGAA